jgi:hypothetical protein
MVERLTWDRKLMLMSATGLLDSDKYQQVLAMSPHNQTAFNMLRAWAQHATQSVAMPEKFAAALAATDGRGVLDGCRMPWPAFEIQVPVGLIPVPGNRGDVTSILVAGRSPEWLALKAGGHLDEDGVIVSLFGGERVCTTMFRSLSDLARSSENVSDWAAPGSLSEMQRVWEIVTKIVAGVLLHIEQCRAESSSAYASRPMRMKNGRLRLSQHVVGSAMKLTVDARQIVRDFVLGVRRSAPSVTTLVRGHWTNQPHGPGRTLRRLQWIQPYWRGEGPVLIRETKIGAMP